MPPTDTPRYTLTELAGLAGVTPRTVRYYTAQGLLPATTSGPGAKYGDAQLARLRVIRRLQREHLPLAAIRQRLEGLDDETVLGLAEAPAPPPPDSALDYIRRVMGSQATVPTGAPPSPLFPRSASPTTAPAAAPMLRSPSMPDASLSAHSLPSVPAPATHGPTPSTAAPGPAGEHGLTRAQWERIAVTPDVEIHVRRPLPRTVAKRVDRLIAIARDLLEEDQP